MFYDVQLALAKIGCHIMIIITLTSDKTSIIIKVEKKWIITPLAIAGRVLKVTKFNFFVFF
jgi:hypothetical protein